MVDKSRLPSRHSTQGPERAPQRALMYGAGVPVENAIRGFYGIQLSAPNLDRIGIILTQVLFFEELSRQPSLENPNEQVVIFGMEGGGPGNRPELSRHLSARVRGLV